MVSLMKLNIRLSEVLTPEEYLALDRRMIKESHFIPPKLGDAGFGKFFVRYRASALAAQREAELLNHVARKRKG